MTVFCGIDLGTTNCCAYYYHNGEEHPLLMKDGKRTFPSAVAFLEDGSTAVGLGAVQARFISQGLTVMNWKRLFGREYNIDYLKKVEISCRARVVPDGHYYAFSIPTRKDLVSPELVCSILLRWICDEIVKVTKTDDLELCLTIPAAYDYHQRECMKTVVQLAGINYPYKFVTEPAAAAISYTINRIVANGHILVYDLGGGTFDASVMEINGNMLKVKNWKGNIDIGGELFDRKIMKYADEKFRADFDAQILPEGVDENYDAAYIRAKQLLLNYCNDVKVNLNFVDSCPINLTGYFRRLIVNRNDDDDGDGNEIEYELSREDFLNMIRDDLRTTMQTVQDCLAECNLTPDDINRVVMVGGSSLIPEVRRLLGEIFGPEKVSNALNCSESIAMGGMRYIYKKEMINIDIVDCVTRSFYLSRMPNRYDLVIPKGSPIPAEGSFNYRLTENNIGYAQASVYEGGDDENERRFIGDLVIDNDDFVGREVQLTFTFRLVEDEVNHSKKLITGFYSDGNRLDEIEVEIQ